MNVILYIVIYLLIGFIVRTILGIMVDHRFKKGHQQVMINEMLATLIIFLWPVVIVMVAIITLGIISRKLLFKLYKIIKSLK